MPKGPREHTILTYIDRSSSMARAKTALAKVSTMFMNSVREDSSQACVPQEASARVFFVGLRLGLPVPNYLESTATRYSCARNGLCNQPQPDRGCSNLPHLR